MLLHIIRSYILLAVILGKNQKKITTVTYFCYFMSSIADTRSDIASFSSKNSNDTELIIVSS